MLVGVGDLALLRRFIIAPSAAVCDARPCFDCVPLHRLPAPSWGPRRDGSYAQRWTCAAGPDARSPSFSLPLSLALSRQVSSRLHSLSPLSLYLSPLSPLSPLSSRDPPLAGSRSRLWFDVIRSIKPVSFSWFP